jgi:hypothetical protein
MCKRKGLGTVQGRVAAGRPACHPAHLAGPSRHASRNAVGGQGLVGRMGARPARAGCFVGRRARRETGAPTDAGLVVEGPAAIARPWLSRRTGTSVPHRPARALLQSRPAAEDLIHDVFLEAGRRSVDYLEERGSVRTWLLLRTRSRALDRAMPQRSRRPFRPAPRAQGHVKLPHSVPRPEALTSS